MIERREASSDSIWGYCEEMEPKKANRAILITAIAALLLILLCLCFLFDWIPQKEEEPKVTTTTKEVTVVVTASPSPTPAKKHPSADDLKGSSDKLVYPKESSYLKDYETFSVKPESGKTTFLLYKPEKLKFTSDRILDLEMDTVVTAVAKENGYTLVLLQDGVAGWVQTFDLKAH